MIIISI